MIKIIAISRKKKQTKSYLSIETMIIVLFVSGLLCLLSRVVGVVPRKLLRSIVGLYRAFSQPVLKVIMVAYANVSVRIGILK